MNIEDLLTAHGITSGGNSSDKVPPPPLTNLQAEAEDKKVTLTWTNPVDSDFVGVRIQRKVGSYPTSITDGATVFNGSGMKHIDTTVENDMKYYYRAFTFDYDNNFNVDTSQQVNAIPTETRIYGVKIDTTNSNPETALTYTDSAVGFTPASMGSTTFNYGSWENIYPFNQIKPCLFKDGAVVGYLNPNDYSKFVDGSTADITSGSAGDVMIEFPKVYWKFETIGTDLYVRYSYRQIDSSYKCLAHMRGTTEKDKTYISAYLGYSLSSKLRSLSGKTPTATQTIAQFRTLSQTNGSGYDQMAHYQTLMLQVLYIVMFKNRDSQTALGQGYTASTNTAVATTGNLNTKGLFYGEQTGKIQMKFCGVEDFYGNLFYFVDGIATDASYNMLIGNQSFNDTGSGYVNYGQGATGNVGGWINGVQGGAETGFIVKSSGGSATTYYSDYGYLIASRIACFGGSWIYASNAGAFHLQFYNAASYSYATIGARLMFC